jgi:hypothetical protein
MSRLPPYLANVHAANQTARRVDVNAICPLVLLEWRASWHL